MVHVFHCCSAAVFSCCFWPVGASTSLSSVVKPTCTKIIFCRAKLSISWWSLNSKSTKLRCHFSVSAPLRSRPAEDFASRVAVITSGEEGGAVIFWCNRAEKKLLFQRIYFKALEAVILDVWKGITLASFLVRPLRAVNPSNGDKWTQVGDK